MELLIGLVLILMLFASFGLAVVLLIHEACRPITITEQEDLISDLNMNHTMAQVERATW
jgi:hypothetical protein